MVEIARVSNKFDDLLLGVIDETMKYILGEANANIIYNYLESQSCSRREIPQNIDYFSSALRDLIGTGRGQMLGAACILEETIAETLALRLGQRFLKKQPFVFADYISALKELYR